MKWHWLTCLFLGGWVGFFENLYFFYCKSYDNEDRALFGLYDNDDRALFGLYDNDDRALFGLYDNDDRALFGLI